MRKSLCIGTILRSDDNTASAVTQATYVQIGRWAQLRGVELDFIPCMGAGKDLARCEVLGAYYHKSKAEDLLWIDHGNGIPSVGTRDGNFAIACKYLDALLCLEEPIVWGPYVVRGGADPAFACSFPGDHVPATYVKTERATLPELGTVDVRLCRLGGCGFGWTRMRRDVVEAVFRQYRGAGFTSNRLDSGMGEVECVDVFSSLRRRRLQDTERSDRPMRLEPEDDSFWHRMREKELGFYPHAMVDFPIVHGKTCADFADFYGIPSAYRQEEKRASILGADGAPLQ